MINVINHCITQILIKNLSLSISTWALSLHSLQSEAEEDITLCWSGACTAAHRCLGHVLHIDICGICYSTECSTQAELTHKCVKNVYRVTSFDGSDNAACFMYAGQEWKKRVNVLLHLPWKCSQFKLLSVFCTFSGLLLYCHGNAQTMSTTTTTSSPWMSTEVQ